MFSIIKKDFVRYCKIEAGSINPSLMNKIRLILATPGFHAVIVYRFGVWVLKRRNQLNLIRILTPIYLLLNKTIVNLYDIKISQAADISPGFYVGHFAGIEIGPCVIGCNCSVAQQVKLCSQIHTASNVTNIGNNVWVGAHAVIGCGLKIGDGVTIGAGSIVNTNIEISSLVLGNPARVVQKNYDNVRLL